MFEDDQRKSLFYWQVTALVKTEAQVTEGAGAVSPTCLFHKFGSSQSNQPAVKVAKGDKIKIKKTKWIFFFFFLGWGR